MEQQGIIIPRHIGIIMDGNGRWAQRRGLPRSAGHIKGAEVFKTVVRRCEKLGVEAVTIFAFSTENWARPADEVRGIMDLLRRYLDDVFTYFGETIRIRFIGDRSRLDADIREKIERIEADSRDNTGMILNLAVNYGGRADITAAAVSLARSVKNGELDISDIDENAVAMRLSTALTPELDMILRPSGEQRLSNFLLWDAAYCEFVFMNTLWPDFTPELLEDAIKEFSSRKRRYGGI